MNLTLISLSMFLALSVFAQEVNSENTPELKFTCGEGAYYEPREETRECAPELFSRVERIVSENHGNEGFQLEVNFKEGRERADYYLTSNSTWALFLTDNSSDEEIAHLLSAVRSSQRFQKENYFRGTPLICMDVRADRCAAATENMRIATSESFLYTIESQVQSVLPLTLSTEIFSSNSILRAIHSIRITSWEVSGIQEAYEGSQGRIYIHDEMSSEQMGHFVRFHVQNIALSSESRDGRPLAFCDFQAFDERYETLRSELWDSEEPLPFERSRGLDEGRNFQACNEALVRFDRLRIRENLRLVNRPYMINFDSTASEIRETREDGISTLHVPTSFTLESLRSYLEEISSDGQVM